MRTMRTVHLLPVALLLCLGRLSLACDRGLTELRTPETLHLVHCRDSVVCERVFGAGAHCQPDPHPVARPTFRCCGSKQVLLRALSQTAMYSRNGQYNYGQTWYARNYQHNNIVERPTVSEPQSAIADRPRVYTHATTQRPHRTHNHAASSVSVRPLVVGQQYESSETAFSGSPTVVLVQDSACKLVVNTGLPAHSHAVHKAVCAGGLRTAQITHVVLTSSQLPHIGNLNLFPRAQLLSGKSTLNHMQLTGNELRLSDHTRICKSIGLLRTPGPTPDALTVLVYDVRHFGTIAITGSLFIGNSTSANHHSDLLTWSAPLAQASRERVICSADYIMPGYGRIFPVTTDDKRNAGCLEEQKEDDRIHPTQQIHSRTKQFELDQP